MTLTVEIRILWMESFIYFMIVKSMKFQKIHAYIKEWILLFTHRGSKGCSLFNLHLVK